MSKHFFALPKFIGVVVVAAVTVACDKSHSGATAPSPVPAPAPPPVPTLTVASVSPSIGPVNVVSEIQVNGTGFVNGATVTLDGVATEIIRVTSTTIKAMAAAHTPGTVDVVVTNPDGSSAMLARAYRFEVPSISLSASPDSVSAREVMTLTWSGPGGRGCLGGGDWIALYKVGDPDNTGATNGHSDLWFTHVCGATSGTAAVVAPAQAAEYEFRFMMGGTSVARSNPVKVVGSAPPSSPVASLMIDGGTASTRHLGETFWVTGSGYTPNGQVSRYIDPPVNGSTSMTPLTADPLGNVSWTFTPTCATVDPKNIVTIYAVDDGTGRTSNTVTETIIGSCP